eukprot:Hpha_TRINITY_DN34893_c0_g1::TRINITY_DN34893_c0_g1_i1::g.167883::m.167883
MTVEGARAALQDFGRVVRRADAEPSPESARGAAGLRSQFAWLLLARLAHLAPSVGASSAPGEELRVLEAAAERHPQHPQFVALFIRRARQRPGGVHRVRCFFSRMLAGTLWCPVVMLYALHAELAILGGCPRRIRGLVDAGMRNAECRRCEMLWRLVFAFEAGEMARRGCSREDVARLRRERDAGFEAGMKIRDRKRLEQRLGMLQSGLERAQRALYQALAEIPGSVRLAVDGLSTLFGAFDPAEVREVVESLLDRDLHLRAFVEECVPPPTKY